ncbi:MAG: hypothetical protein HY306_03945 [Nitrosomonadales bacterium]|nr:hypothetical protein [Nitrosomonadales bacterium]
MIAKEHRMRTTEQKDSLALLTRRHSGLLLPLAAAAQEIGINPRTAHNQISKGIFPIPTILRDRRRYVHINELASYLDGLRQQAGEVNSLSRNVSPQRG